MAGPGSTDHIVVLTLGASGAVALIALIVARPQFAAYSNLAASPLIAGVARGEMLGILRPNEALLLVIAAALALRTLLATLAHTHEARGFTRVDLGLVVLALASSIVPLLARLASGLSISSDDLLYSIVLWKYFVLFRCCRASITTPAQLRCCIAISLTSAAISCSIGLIQVTGLFGVPQFLHSYFDQPFEGHGGLVTDRATSTLASSFGFADVMIMNLLIALSLLGRRRRPQWLFAASSLIFICGIIASGEFSSFIGLGVALLAFGLASGRLSVLLARAIPSAVIASTALWFVVANRLQSVHLASSALPPSWIARWNNLQTFFFPELLSGLNWLWGVRPAPRIAAPEHWRQFVYIESGYVWLLWIGGLPFLVAFLFFAWTSGHHLWRVARSAIDEVASVAMAAFCYLIALLVLMLLDPHLTLRGSADLFFPLLGLSFVGTWRRELAGHSPAPAQPYWRPVPRPASVLPMERAVVAAHPVPVSAKQMQI